MSLTNHSPSIEDAESEALRLFELAGMDPANDHGALRVAARLPGVQLTFAKSLGCKGDTIVRSDGTRVIRLDSALGPSGAEFICGHEMGHHAFGRRQPGCSDVVAERVCTRIGVALTAPRNILFRLRLACGLRLDRIAGLLGTTETVIALRFGEVFDDEPFAVVTPRWIRANQAFGNTGGLRRAIANGTKRLAAHQLTDCRRSWIVQGRW